MSAVRLLFSSSNSPMGAVIRAATWSRWSHVALVAGDAVIEAAPFYGVRQVTLDDAIGRARETALVELPARNPQRIIGAARSQLGKPYDWTAVLGLGLRRDWQERDAWFCSELIAWSAAEAGEPWYRCESLRRVTPQHLWMLPPVGELCTG